MFGDEEPLDDARYMRMSSQQQMELIQRYCGGIEEKIKGAPSGDAARTLADEACGAFEKECPSDLIRRTLLRRVREMVEEHWGAVDSRQ